VPRNLVRAVLARARDAVERARVAWVRLSHAGVSIGPGARIASGVEVKVTDGGRLDIGAGVVISRGVTLVVEASSMAIGPRTYIGPWCTLVSRERISIGADCLLAERVSIRDQDHDIHRGATVPMNAAGMTSAPVEIGDDVWIAAGAVVLKGTTIGRGAVIAANAVVRAPVPGFAIAAGVPARIVALRKQDAR
jgi:acetyltransferase-like isoleucine patch superfamily enzyme